MAHILQGSNVSLLESLVLRPLTRGVEDRDGKTIFEDNAWSDRDDISALGQLTCSLIEDLLTDSLYIQVDRRVAAGVATLNFFLHIAALALADLLPAEPIHPHVLVGAVQGEEEPSHLSVDKADRNTPGGVSLQTMDHSQPAIIG